MPKASSSYDCAAFFLSSSLEQDSSMQLHGKLQSIVIVLTLLRATSTNRKLLFHSSTLDNLGQTSLAVVERVRLAVHFVFDTFVATLVDLTRPMLPKTLGFRRSTVCARPPNVKHPTCVSCNWVFRQRQSSRITIRISRHDQIFSGAGHPGGVQDTDTKLRLVVGPYVQPMEL
jgi:hypothetical protein